MDAEHLSISAQFIDAAICYLCAINDGLLALLDADSRSIPLCTPRFSTQKLRRSALANMTLATTLFKGDSSTGKSSADDASMHQLAYKLLIYH